MQLINDNLAYFEGKKLFMICLKCIIAAFSLSIFLFHLKLCKQVQIKIIKCCSLQNFVFIFREKKISVGKRFSSCSKNISQKFVFNMKNRQRKKGISSGCFGLGNEVALLACLSLCANTKSVKFSLLKTRFLGFRFLISLGFLRDVYAVMSS